MLTIPRIERHKQDKETIELVETFFEIDKRARLAGRVDILLELDRLEGLMLGPVSHVQDGSELIAIGEAYVALDRIMHALEADPTLKQNQVT